MQPQSRQGHTAQALQGLQRAVSEANEQRRESDKALAANLGELRQSLDRLTGQVARLTEAISQLVAGGGQAG